MSSEKGGQRHRQRDRGATERERDTERERATERETEAVNGGH